MYKMRISVQKGAVETAKVSAIIMAILKVLDVDLTAEQATAVSVLPGVAAGLVRGIRNWVKNRKRVAD